MPNIAAPVYKNYADFKASEWYNKVMSRNGVEYIFYEETPGVDNVLLPITKGENVTASETTEKLEVDQWGQSIIDEYVDGKTRITGTVGIFYSASQADVLPTTQDFVGRRFKIIKKVAPGFPGAGIPLLMWDKVAINQKDYASQRGGIKLDIRFVASRSYNAQELADMGIV